MIIDHARFEEVEIAPRAIDIMNATRSMGYTTESAIADIIDNSISANAKKISIYFPPSADIIKIIDDGDGMSSDELKNAMRYGCDLNYKREDSDLGRFGLGLKTASFSQCEVLTVISKKNGRTNSLRWDPTYIEKNGCGWIALSLQPEEIFKYSLDTKFDAQHSGTIVIWENLSLMLAGESDYSSALSLKMESVRNHIRLVFHRFLSGEDGLSKIEISFNDKVIQPIDPFLKSKSMQISDVQKILVPELGGNEVSVSIKRYLLPSVSKLSKTELNMLCGDSTLARTQGFYVYRNKRLLVWGTWFRLALKTNTSKLSRIQIDIPSSLDKLWSLDVKKSTAKPPEIIRKNLKSLIHYSQNTSKNTFIAKSKLELHSKINHFWERTISSDESINYQINKAHPLILEFSDKLSNDQRKVFERLLFDLEQFIPINQMFLDMEDEKTIGFASDEMECSIRQEIGEILDRDHSKTIIQILKTVEPFARYPELVEEILNQRGIL
ncbi:ATP-binding region ATPase domain-containing protein [Sphaerochaeta globosa str. Buddy]|uniref:ATP-binding region ATPase domain-containing protein n=1 Tax=Sphaerochaeta globosa (strain ATCC BAA-1886 / DSM 22777 / Buddy) TaxID=158189 RepID=F0RW28_SPHGB|nr:ATP-binding region ATPase domain-containing protein [Sphaerochaeta globosa str. Buddy]